MTTWISDANGNRCSISYFGSQEAAQKALDSLEGCRNCTNCSYCSYCSDCSDCSDCSYCSRCSRCSRCSDCSGCSGCSYCSRCSRCSRCSDCSDCSGCSGLKSEHRGQSDTKPEALGAPAVPTIDNINAKVFAAASQPYALVMDTWHTCGTTHCRAGWVVTLAGEEGKKLESFFNTELAAMLIYRESGSPINPARFYDSDTDALADMKRLAEAEAQVQP